MDEGKKEDLIKKYNLEHHIIKYFKEDYTYEAILKLLENRHNVTICRRTLERFLQKQNLKRKNIKLSSLEDIIAAMHIELQNSGFNLGYRSMWKRLRMVYNLEVTQELVLKVLQIIDPEGIQERRRNRLRRRQYYVPGPNYTWHVDGYDKISRYGFSIHGCTDGFSRKILWLETSTTNKKPEVIAFYYLQTILKYDCVPSVLRTDKGTENSILGVIQECLRHTHCDDKAGEKSYIVGKSTANVRVESMWGQLRRQSMGFYINLFHCMEENEELDVDDPLQIECLRYCFSHLISYDLGVFKKSWNEHRIRKQNGRNIRGGIPNELYNLPTMFGADDYGKPFNKNHVDIIQEKYTIKPQFYNEKMHEFFQHLPNFKVPPTTAVEAHILYKELLKILQQ